MNFSDLRESRQIFPFVNNLNGSINKSGSLVMANSGVRDEKNSVFKPKIKVTSSFDDIFR
jgi:hypothetical protein